MTLNAPTATSFDLPPGSVALVGAGPGDPGLLTLNAVRALEAAEVVLYDRLVGVGVLALAGPQAQLVEVGKSAGNHSMPQEQIHALMLEHARAGRRVVRHTPLLVKMIIVGVRDQDHLDAVVSLPGVAEAITYTAGDTENEGNIPGLVRRVARLDPQALQRFFNAVADGEIVKPVGVEVGSNVVVMVGPFASFPAIVEAILPNDRLKVAVSIFGRPSPVELGIADVTLV